MIKAILLHIKSIFKNKWDLARLRNANAIYKLRSARGKDLIDAFRDVALWGNMYVILSLKWPWFKMEYFIFIIPIYIVGTYFLGYIDEQFFKFWQEEREQSAIHANPFNSYIKESLDELLRRIK